MREKRSLILSAEEYFARRVALGVIVRRPTSPWLQLIPGMFIFDAYKRSRETRLFSQYFMAPRKIAMDAAQCLVQGEPRDVVLPQAQEKVRAWLIAQRLDSDAVLDREMAVVGLLTDHYSRLLRVDGASHADLVTEAYHDRERYEDYLKQLARLENEADNAVSERFGHAEGLRKDLALKQKVKEELRVKDMDTIF